MVGGQPIFQDYFKTKESDSVQNHVMVTVDDMNSTQSHKKFVSKRTLHPSTRRCPNADDNNSAF